MHLLKCVSVVAASLLLGLAGTAGAQLFDSAGNPLRLCGPGIDAGQAYTQYTKLEHDTLALVVSAAQKDRLVPKTWWFPIVGRVPYKGSMIAILHQLMGGLRSSMGYTGCASIEEMRTKPEFIRVTSAGVKESHVHDVSITKEAPNYRV